MAIGKIKRVPLREVWPNEAHDFTPWLCENIDVLNEIIEPTLSAVEREQAAGAFSVDLVAQDQNGNAVVIENQLEKSDHDHLGKLITYLASFEAKTAIWIVKHPRTEHASAITWLNESSSADFYLVKVEAIRIDNSPPAPLLTQIVGPSEAGKAVANRKQELSETTHRFRDFWPELLAAANSQTKLHCTNTPSTAYYIGASAGYPGCYLTYVALQFSWRVELYIDSGEKTHNDHCFESLEKRQCEIEKEFGAPLDWQLLEAKRACRIAFHGSSGGWGTARCDWPGLHAEMIAAMIRLEKAMRDPVQAIGQQ